MDNSVVKFIINSQILDIKVKFRIKNVLITQISVMMRMMKIKEELMVRQ
jgi:hypothetical protein